MFVKNMMKKKNTAIIKFYQRCFLKLKTEQNLSSSSQKSPKMEGRKQGEKGRESERGWMKDGPKSQRSWSNQTDVSSSRKKENCQLKVKHCNWCITDITDDQGVGISGVPGRGALKKIVKKLRELKLKLNWSNLTNFKARSWSRKFSRWHFLSKPSSYSDVIIHYLFSVLTFYGRSLSVDLASSSSQPTSCFGVLRLYGLGSYLSSNSFPVVSPTPWLHAAYHNHPAPTAAIPLNCLWRKPLGNPQHLKFGISQRQYFLFPHPNIIYTCIFYSG